MIHLEKGLNIPISGSPSSTQTQAFQATEVAVIGPDYIGMKPTFFVQESDRVKTGQPIFEDKKKPGVIFTSPASGVVEIINRGAKRTFQSIVIKVEGEENYTFRTHLDIKIDKYEAAQIRALLIESGMWTAFRTRPFSKTPEVNTSPHSIFITAMDTNPLAPCVETILKNYPNEFTTGLKIIKKFTSNNVYLCKASGSVIPGCELPNIKVKEFFGPHPAGLPGTHIHFIDPVHSGKTVWHIGYQDVVAIGHLFMTGHLMTERTIALAGPQVENPRLLKTRLGARVVDLVYEQLKEGINRVISGSVLSGRTAQGPFAYLGRFHNQISVIEESNKKEFLGWISPGQNKFSTKPLFLSSLFRNKLFNMTTSTNGAQRALVPTGCFEKVMPLDIEPNFLLRALAIKDTEQAQALGCLELDEEDMALMTFVDASKNNFAPMLRENLNLIEKEG